MYINNLISLLLELAAQSGSRVSPVAKVAGPAGAQNVAVPGKKAPGVPDTSPPGAQPARAEARPEGEQPVTHPPAFAPLPLRSFTYQEARFYARLGGEKAGGGAKAQSTEIFICLVTESLGQVWVALSCREDVLSVHYFTESELASRRLKEDFAPLRENLRGLGFPEVALTSRAQNGLGNLLEGLLPRFDEHLLDRKI